MGQGLRSDTGVGLLSLCRWVASWAVRGRLRCFSVTESPSHWTDFAPHRWSDNWRQGWLVDQDEETPRWKAVVSTEFDLELYA